MILGEYECDCDTAYFMEHGEYPKKENACKQSYMIEDIEHEDDLYIQYQESNFYERFQNTYKYCLWQ